MKKILVAVTLIFQGVLCTAQYCIPTANCSGDDYINNFTFNTISNLNSAGSDCSNDSYTNTGFTTTVDAGSSYSFTIESGPTWEQAFGIWIDFNQDNDFNDPGEFVYGSANSTTQQLSGTITIPTSASSGSTRMRVRSQYLQTISSSESCANFSFGETEDYTLEIQYPNTPPIADFKSNTTLTCNGTISFTDLSGFNPTSWAWDFGDGNTSTIQHPSHTYQNNGTYTVSLTVTNAFGSDMVTFTDYIVVNSSIAQPTTASCTPQTTNGFAGFGITNVTLHSINNTSSDGLSGYEDFTCITTSLTTGKYYHINVSAGSSQNHNIRGWIDYNNDGAFNSSELVLSQDNVITAEDSIFIPNTAILNSPLRMRISADYFLQPSPTECGDLQNGQAEDYTIIIEENTEPPVANFHVNNPIVCSESVTFSDLSTNIPTQWNWDFGDGTTSTLQHPSHLYNANGVYTVTLIVHNNFGSDTITYDSLIHVNLNGAVTPASCLPNTTNACCEYGIYSVKLQDINKGSIGSEEGYQDYTCTDHTTIGISSCYELEIRTGPTNNEDVKVWIDFNNDGDFSNALELVFESFNNKIHSGIITVPYPGVTTDTVLRMRVISEASGNAIDPCSNVLFGQTEDYGITILDEDQVPGVFFSADELVSCDGLINFTNESCGNGTSFLWDFGDGNTSTDENPSHQYNSLGLFDIKLEVTNAVGTNSKTQHSYIEITSTHGQPITPSCQPQTNAQNGSAIVGISNVKFNTINKSSVLGIEGYQDNTCDQQTTVERGTSYIASITTGEFNSENVRIWIDFNNSGTFSNSELVFSSSGTETHTGSINIPNSAVTDTPLRMRVWSDFDGTAGVITSCTSPQYGQAEDYTVIVSDPNSGPIANFSVDSTITCKGTVQFNNLSSSSATSFLWEFGDGTSSTVANPVHTYTSFGTYSVTLTSSNSSGSNSITYSNLVNYINDCALVGFPELFTEDQLFIYPNPTNGEVNINYRNLFQTPYNIRVINTLGKIVYLETIDEIESIIKLNLDNYPSGMYVVFVEQDGLSFSRKILLNR